MNPTPGQLKRAAENWASACEVYLASSVFLDKDKWLHLMYTEKNSKEKHYAIIDPQKHLQLNVCLLGRI